MVGDDEPPLRGDMLVGIAPGLAGVVVANCTSRTKMSGMPFVSPGTKLLAALTNAT